MPLRLLGSISSLETSDRVAVGRASVDPLYTDRLAAAHEIAGFDAVLAPLRATLPDSWALGAWVLARNTRLGALIAHRPGTVAPTVVARHLATLDQLGRGRVALHVITGGDEDDLARDGDFLQKDARYRRTAEFIMVLRLELEAVEPFDFDGEFYKVRGARSDVLPFTHPRPPISMAGTSEAALDVAAAYADLWSMWGGPLTDAAKNIRDVKDRAHTYGNELGIFMTFRVILGRTEDDAWRRAREARDRVERSLTKSPALPADVGGQRLLAAAEQHERCDRALFLGIAKVLKGAANSAVLVGTAETVADALLDYYDLGAHQLFIRGYDQIEDATTFGEELIPRLRSRVADREAGQVPAL